MEKGPFRRGALRQAGVWPESGDARKGRGGALGDREPGLETRPGLGATRGRVCGVGVTMRWGLGRGLKGPGAELERGRVWGAWAWSAGASSSGVPTRRRQHQTRPCPPISFRSLSPLSSPSSRLQALSPELCPRMSTVHSLHAPWGAPGPGAGGPGGFWAGFPGRPSSLRTCPGPRLSPGPGIQGGPAERTPAAADPL